MTHFNYTLEGPLGSRATLGMIVLQTDETLEHDLRRSFTAGDIALYVSRVPSGADVTPETLAQMSAALPAAARLLPPDLTYDVVGYGCTSGTAVIGPEKIAEQVRAGCDARAVTDPLSALVALCQAKGIARLAFLSPYIESVSRTLRDALAARGIETPVFGSFDEAVESKVAKISQASLYEAAMALGASDAVEAVFLSCTNLRTLDVIPRIEADLGKPVFSSNQALAWHMGVLAGLNG
ncbi:aspartate/glutamate racemase family protein [Sulfitobacter aestuariivivens]|uniref:Aspartate/glutamate racemase family protein n=1 Tax=Sulfitobacter aestuariivivens TaxID=2766981 RepID=A0A927D7D5_9RHOB|nr:aspartate/glutamate racemase family protein [Sulfitobacter aestuariivivens]MBD3664126.1 aspartate/glutamate racemase family protein [Sulfitobacter aestuariivivens]